MFTEMTQGNNILKCNTNFPFFDGVKCLQCGDSNPYFNLGTKKCDSCGGQVVNHVCQWFVMTLFFIHKRKTKDYLKMIQSDFHEYNCTKIINKIIMAFRLSAYEADKTNINRLWEL